MNDQERETLKYVVGELLSSESRLYELSSSNFNWLMGTLFAANAGGIALLFDRNSTMETGLNASWLFASGIIFCLLTGVFSSLHGYYAIKKFNKFRSGLQEALLTDDITPASVALEEFNKLPLKTWIGWIPSSTAALSMACLIGGGICALRSM